MKLTQKINDETEKSADWIVSRVEDFTRIEREDIKRGARTNLDEVNMGTTSYIYQAVGLLSGAASFYLGAEFLCEDVHQIFFGQHLGEIIWGSTSAVVDSLGTCLCMKTRKLSYRLHNELMSNFME